MVIFTPIWYNMGISENAERSRKMEEYLNDSLVDYSSYDEDEYSKYKDSTYEIVSKIAYLIGIPKRIFENENQPPKIEVYNTLDTNKNARIIRHLCAIRTSIERRFKRINESMRFEHRSILNMPEYIPEESITQLENDGISFYKKSSIKLVHHLIEINRLISDRINNCKGIFPNWINWDYIKDLFIMPDGLTEAGTKAAADLYFSNLDFYPYRFYINWSPYQAGNILYNDKKFVNILYEMNNDYFTDYSRVSDAGKLVKSNIYDFIQYAQRVVMVVDCENSDPYRLCAVLNGLDGEELSKVQKIMLLDDVNTVNAWRILESYTDIPIEHIMTERIKHNKSLVDIELTARTCMEHYKNMVDSFILVSSDSDYWGLINSLPDAAFLVMLEREKCGPDMKAALTSGGIFYCYIEDFYSGNSEAIKQQALFNEIYNYLDQVLHLNVNDMLSHALESTRIEMSTNEKQRFYDKHIRSMSVVIDDEGNVRLELGKK